MEAAVHKRNLESSILFMQQEHAATLKALHEEIHKLQKKCTDLTFQLTMNGISVEDQGDVDSRLQDVHEQLQESQTHESRLQGQLSQGTQHLQQLQQELRGQQKCHLDEMRQASQTISSLRAEVEAKSNNIAFLTTQLHRLKVKQKVGDGSGGKGHRTDPGPTIVRGTHYSHLPAPPRDMLTSSARLRQRASHPLPSPGMRRTGPAPTPTISSTGVSGAEAEALARTLRVTSASARSSSGSESPDITPFVNRDLDGAVAVVGVKKPAPLPPIISSNHTLTAAGVGGGLGEREAHLDKKDLSKVVVAKKGHRAVSRPRPATPEVATLAVDQVSDANWKRPSQPSSEYK